MHKNSSTKQCNKCHQIYPAAREYFERNPKCKGGFAHTCRACRVARKRELRRQRGIATHRWSGIEGNSKECLRCESWKPLSEFGLAKNGRAGRRSICQACRREENRLNREARQKRARAYYQANREQIIARASEWQQAHREQRQSYLKQYRIENLEWLLEQQAKHRAANADGHRHDAKQRRAKIKGAVGAHTIADIRSKYKDQNGLCYWCKQPLNGVYHVDHVIPIAKGGSNGPGNICCACPPCNLSKGAKMPYEFSDRLF